jgi:predicted phage terminase large subunit-like protein
VQPVSESQPKAIDLPAGGWREWLALNFPNVATAPFAERHVRLWDWFDALKVGVRPRPAVEVWPRGGAKSSTAELATAWMGLKLTRRFVLIVSETQEQADLHVQSIASLFERIDVERAVGKYGSSKGWRRNQLRVANGFNVAALGLDTASRGIKLDEFRPDAILFDDIDNSEDTPKTIQKKIRIITSKLLPAGSADCAILFLQNLIREDGVVGQLVSGEADFLHDRNAAKVEPAVYGLETRLVMGPDGRNVYEVTAGKPSWEGQSIAVVQAQINAWGFGAFMREGQHEVEGANGLVFKVAQFRTCKPEDVPPLVAVCLCFDLAATEGGGDHTAGVLLGRCKRGLYYVLALIRGQWSSERVQACIKFASAYYKPLFPVMRLRLPQDPGQAGKAQKAQMQTNLSGFAPGIAPETGKKVTRAMPFAEEVNLGNVLLVEQNLPPFLSQRVEGSPLMSDLTWQTWHRILKNKLKAIQEDVADQEDDEMDAAAGGFNEVALKRVSAPSSAGARPAAQTGYTPR